MQNLLDLAIEEPERARIEAERVVAARDSNLALSYAHQCLGIVYRDCGRLDDALRELRLALKAAGSVDADRLSDVRATYGATLVYSGRTKKGLEQLDLAVRGGSGPIAAKALMRLAGTLSLLGRHNESAPAMRKALAGFVSSGDSQWEARTRIWLAHIELRLGNVEAAQREVEAAEAHFAASAAKVERLRALENLAEIAAARGDIAGALGQYVEVWDGYRAAGVQPHHDPAIFNAVVYLSAGLPGEAVSLLESFRHEWSLAEYAEAEFDLLIASALLAVGDAQRALASAERARIALHKQRREWFEMQARLASVRARIELGQSGRVIAEARAVATALHSAREDAAPDALIAIGRLETGEAQRYWWHVAASYRRHPAARIRLTANLAGALERDQLGDRGGVLRACRSGLDAADEHRHLLGSSELRALATTHSRELTEIALRHAAHDPRTLLRWSERTRATSLAQPPATSDATTIPPSLAALRDNGRRLAEAHQAGESTEDLERERLRLERAVRTESHTISADSDPQRPARVEEIVAGVGNGTLVELVDVDGVLHVLVVHRGRVRRRVAGTTAEVAELLGPASMLLRRAARGRPANMADIGRRLQEVILGDAAQLIPDGPLVLAPTARLHGLVWPLLPTLHDRPFSVVPSAGQWLRATGRKRPSPRRTLLVAGPNLESGGAEVPVLAERHPDAVLLDGPKATVVDVLAQLDGADLAHLATHGHFRADSPLFSALDLADGPLTVHDLERLKRAPYRVVLSACESGVLAPVGAEELLGLAAALFSLGTAGLVSSVAEVNDAATADLMVGLHDALARDEDPAAALLEVRRAAADDPVAAGTAAAFVALGV